MSTHGPVDEDYIAKMQALARVVDELFNPQIKKDPHAERETGFALLIFPFGEQPDGRVNYISNADRDDMIKALCEFIERNTGKHPEETLQ